MIIWSRWGILAVLFFPLALWLGLGAIKPLLFGTVDDNAADAVGVGVALLLMAAVMWLVVHLTVGRLIDKPKPVWIHTEMAEPYIDEHGQEQFFRWVQPNDPRTGEPMVQRPVSTLFFIPVTIWPFVYAGIAVLILVLGIVGLLDGRP